MFVVCRWWSIQDWYNLPDQILIGENKQDNLLTFVKIGCADLRMLRSHVPAAPKLTTRADCTLTSVCRVAAVVNRRLAQTAELIEFEAVGTWWLLFRHANSIRAAVIFNSELVDLAQIQPFPNDR